TRCSNRNNSNPSPQTCKFQTPLSCKIKSALTCREPLTTTRLFAWHSGLFPSGTSELKKIRAGAWRTDEAGPMRVISGPVGREKIHYEAPQANRIEAEMAAFLEWFNGNDVTNLVLRAGIAHLWFVTIHPFEDGNGRIARAIANMLLARSEHGPMLFYSLSEQIFKERNNYYRTLEHAQKGTLDITDYLSWFLECIGQAISTAARMIEILKRKAYFQDEVFPKLNIRQRVVIGKLLDDFKGKLTQTKWSKLAKCTRDAAESDIDDLLTRGILVKNLCNSRVASYSLAGVSNSNYREAMAKAAEDNEFIADSKEVERDFTTLDAEVTNSDEDLARYANKPTYGRDENGVFRLYPDGRKKYFREKRFCILSCQPLNPPLEAIEITIKRAIAKIHAAGLSTVHCDERGRVYLLYPDGRKKYCKPVRSSSEQESDD
ncbi:MAG: Fic family protein, partial [Sporomusaceae bacterium]|nr:Fic family protein [Sporomusaceae bacterium]